MNNVFVQFVVKKSLFLYFNSRFVRIKFKRDKNSIVKNIVSSYFSIKIWNKFWIDIFKFRYFFEFSTTFILIIIVFFIIEHIRSKFEYDFTILFIIFNVRANVYEYIIFFILSKFYICFNFFIRNFRYFSIRKNFVFVFIFV